MAGRWRFGLAELDMGSARLTVDGKPHDLDRSSQELLRCLLDHAGNVVLKEQLLKAGWPGRVVSENSLTKAIGRLRHALDDPQGELLCTVHGYGYRLAMSVEFVPASPGAPGAMQALPALPASLASPAPHATRRRSVFGSMFAMSLGLLSLIGVILWLAAPPPVSNTAEARLPVTGLPASIAVLPFADMSQAGDQAWFSDGLADELLDQLTQLPQLRVAGRTNSFSFRGSRDDVASIGRKLNVGHVLEGSVRRSGDRIRITMQLIDVANGYHVWSQTYDRNLTDLFETQDEIARSVVAALRVELLPSQSAMVSRHRTTSPDAYTQFLIGRNLHMMGTPDNDRRAIAAFERAIALDPRFATAYAALADVLGGESEYADTPEEVAAGKKRALAMMDKAIELDPQLADTYLARADFLYSTNWDWAGAQSDLDKAAALRPGENVGAMTRQCRLFAALGRVREAVALEQRATQIDPTAGELWGMLAYHSLALGDFGNARHALEQAQQLRPNDNHVSFYSGMSLLLQDQPLAAEIEFERGGGPFRLAGLAMAQHDAGKRAQSDEALARLVSRYANTAAYQVAEVHAWRGEIDQAFTWLQRADRQRDAGLIYIKFDPLLGKLRNDPRYGQWLRRMRLPA